MLTLVGVIYLILNLANGKKYVGQTRYTALQRWTQHRGCARAGELHPLYRAIRRDGEDKFKVTTLEVIRVRGVDEQDAKRRRTKKLDAAEKKHIKLHNSFIDDGHGYNLTRGGCGGDMCEETKKKLSLAQKNPAIVVSAETRRKQSESGRNRAPLTAANIEARRKGQIKRYEDPKERRWTGLAAKNHFNSEEGAKSRKICSEAAQAMWASEGRVELQSEKSKAAWKGYSKQTRGRIVAAYQAGLKSYWDAMTPEQRTERVKANWAVRKANAAQKVAGNV